MSFFRLLHLQFQFILKFVSFIIKFFSQILPFEPREIFYLPRIVTVLFMFFRNLKMNQLQSDILILVPFKDKAAILAIFLLLNSTQPSLQERLFSKFFFPLQSYSFFLLFGIKQILSTPYKLAYLVGFWKYSIHLNKKNSKFDWSNLFLSPFPTVQENFTEALLYLKSQLNFFIIFSMSEDQDQTFSLQSFQHSEKEDRKEPLEQSLIVEKEVPLIKNTQDEVDHFYQQLSLSFYSQNFLMHDKKAPRSLNDQLPQTDRQKAKTESSKLIFQQPTLSNGISESTTVESQHQFNFHVSSGLNIVKSNSNENIIRKEQLRTISKNDEITFYTPEFEDKILVLKQPIGHINKTERKPSKIIQSPPINKASGSTSFYQVCKKKQRHPPIQKPDQNFQQNPPKESEKMNSNCYFTQKQRNQQPKDKKKVIEYVADKINLSVLKKLIDKNKKNSTSNSFYFMKKGKASPDSPCSSATSNLSVKSGNTSSKLLSLLQSPYMQSSSKKQSPNPKNKPKKIIQIQQNAQQQYLEKQLQEIRKFQTIQAIKNNICKADYGIESQYTPREESKSSSNQLQMNLDKQLKKLLRKPR